jgi:5-methylcytosine-specific restriction enzyme subunit McrC
LAAQLDVVPVGHGRYRVRAGGFAGFVALPGGQTLSLVPRVPVDTLFALLAAVYDPGREVFRQEPQGYTTVAALFEFVVAIWATQVEDLLARGLLRGYQSVIGAPPAVRGRLLPAETARRRPGLEDRQWCAYQEWTPDIPENRLFAVDRARLAGRALSHAGSRGPAAISCACAWRGGAYARRPAARAAF